MKKLLLIVLLPVFLWGKGTDSLKVDLGARTTSYFMTTHNGLFGPYSELKDYYASAVGVEMLLAARKNNWSLETDLFLTTKVMHNAFEEDAITGKTSRYESGLFSVTNREQAQIFMPSIIELAYQKKGARLALGNFALDGFS